jgi:hypothetical protein
MSQTCHIRTHAAQHHSVRSTTRSAAIARLGQQKARQSSRSQTSTRVSGTVLVNTPTLERRQLVQTTTVAIACTAGAYALLLGGLCARQGTSGVIGIARIESSILKDRGTANAEDGKRPLGAFHGSAPIEIDSGTGQRTFPRLLVT